MVHRPTHLLPLFVVVVTALLASWLLARGGTRWAAARWLPLRAVAAAPAERGPRSATSPTTKRADPTPILARNIFDPDLGDLTAAPETAEATTSEEPAEEELPVDGSLPTCEGSMRLVGTVYRPRRPEQSIAAIIGVAGKARLYRVGGDIDGSQLLAIGRNRVVLRPQGGAPCQLVMFTGQPKPSRSGGRIRIARAGDDKGKKDRAGSRSSSRTSGVESAELDRGITRVSDTRFSIERSLVDKLLSNQAELMRAARIIPHQRGGRVVGVKLYGIRRGSLLSRLGLQNGDLLRTINGFDMSSPDKALEAYTKLRSASHLTVAIERRGQSMTLDYDIR